MIVNAGLRRFKPGGRSGGVIASFVADYIANGGIGPARGTAPSFTRATTATITDQDMVVRSCVSGEARFGGFRRVQNLLGYLSGTSLAGSSEDITSANWGLAGGASRTATSLTFGASATDGITRTFINTATGSVNRVFVQRVQISTSSGTKGFRLQITHTGVASYTSGDLTATTTPQIFSFTATLTSAAGTAVTYSIINESGAVAGAINVTKHQVEEVTGQSNQNPAEYVSVGVLSAPYHGAGVDGVKYFPYLNGNTVV